MKKLFLLPIVFMLLIFSSNFLSSCGAKEMKDKEITMDKTKSVSTDKPASNGAKNTSELKDEGGFEESAQTTSTDAVSPQKTAEDIKEPSKTAVEKVPTKIIKTADISMQVKSYEKSRKAILDMVKVGGGYISSENQSNGTYSIVNDIEIRIKPEGFDNLTDKIAAQGIFIDYKKITADDVTDEYVDATARLKSKKEVELRYSDILKKANSISEILAVEEKLRQIREEIEAYQGKIKLLDDQVGYSTIKVHFYEKLDYTPTPEYGFGHKIAKAIKTGWNGFLMFIIGVIYLWPVWLVAGAIVWLVLRIIKRGKKKIVK